jgi:hypothetical protein
MSMFMKMKQKMGKTDALPAPLAALFARHKSLRDIAKATEATAVALKDAHNLLSIAQMEAREAIEKLPEREAVEGDVVNTDDEEGCVLANIYIYIYIYISFSL